MPRVVFTPNLTRHVPCPPLDAEGATVREVLSNAFQDRAELKDYILDDQGTLRRHMVIFVDGRQIKDRTALSDKVEPSSEIYVMQALSGG